MQGFNLWSISDSNRSPQHCQRCALPDELIPHIILYKATQNYSNLNVINQYLKQTFYVQDPNTLLVLHLEFLS